MDMLEKFWDKVLWREEPHCWRWIGPKDIAGYGTFWTGKFTARAHRVSYELFTRSQIPEGLVIDHLCRHPDCVNPRHLEPVTSSENVKRGKTYGSRTHCIHGHEFTPENTRIYARPGGTKHRYCLRCLYLRGRLRFDPRFLEISLEQLDAELKAKEIAGSTRK